MYVRKCQMPNEKGISPRQPWLTCVLHSALSIPIRGICHSNQGAILQVKLARLPSDTRNMAHVDHAEDELVDEATVCTCACSPSLDSRARARTRARSRRSR